MECFWLTEKICILIQNIFCQYLFFNFANKDWTGGIKINFEKCGQGDEGTPKVKPIRITHGWLFFLYCNEVDGRCLDQDTQKRQTLSVTFSPRLHFTVHMKMRYVYLKLDHDMSTDLATGAPSMDKNTSFWSQRPLKGLLYYDEDCCPSDVGKCNSNNTHNTEHHSVSVRSSSRRDIMMRTLLCIFVTIHLCKGNYIHMN